MLLACCIISHPLLSEFHLEDMNDSICNKLGSHLNPQKNPPFSDARALARKFSIPEEVWSHFDDRMLFENIVTYLSTKFIGKYTVSDLLKNLVDVERLDVALILAVCIRKGHLKAECQVCQAKKTNPS